MSPSTRREWIEIQLLALYQQLEDGLPPHGGSGLKLRVSSMMRKLARSPSTRREWIEIAAVYDTPHASAVSLHTEGVD